MLKNLFKRFNKQPAKVFDEPALMNTFARQPVSFDRGDGLNLWDDEGKLYLDALGGIAVAILGHSHPTINKTISLQAARLMHSSNLFHIKEQAELGEKFCQIAQMEKVFICNSGTEANEAAIKIARKYGNNKGVSTPTVITFKGGFHGRTMGALSATANEGLQKGFTPLLPGFMHLEYNNIKAIEAVKGDNNIVAVMVEPILGESGVIVPDEGYLSALRQLCDDNDWLLICDEIQTGMGRTGKWFAYQHENILPDVMTSAKALGNGVPIGACAARGKAAQVLQPGDHGSTFGGNHFACKVAMTVIDTMNNDKLVENAAEMGALLKKQLQQKLGTHEKVTNVRGKGLMVAVELDQAYEGLAQSFLEQGLVVNITGGGKVIRLLPAAIIKPAQVKKITDTILQVVNQLS